MNEIKYIILYLVPVPEPYLINYGSGSDFLTSYGSVSTCQKVTVPTVPVPVPQHWRVHLRIREKTWHTWNINKPEVLTLELVEDTVVFVEGA